MDSHRSPAATSLAPRSTGTERAHTVLVAILGAALVVSIVHYTDNYLGYEHYPQLESGPNPSPSVILAAWFVFTAFGIAGYLLVRRDRTRAAAVCLAVYSVSGLIGLGHYAVPGVGHLAWWRHVHILVDVGCGAAVLVFAVWLGAEPARRPLRPAVAALDEAGSGSARHDHALQRDLCTCSLGSGGGEHQRHRRGVLHSAADRLVQRDLLA